MNAEGAIGEMAMHEQKREPSETRFSPCAVRTNYGRRQLPAGFRNYAKSIKNGPTRYQHRSRDGLSGIRAVKRRSWTTTPTTTPIHEAVLGGVLGSCWAFLGLCWVILGASWGHLQSRKLAHHALGAILGSSWDHVWPSWNFLGLSWAPLGVTIRCASSRTTPLAPFWGLFGIMLGHLGTLLGYPGVHPGAILRSPSGAQVRAPRHRRHFGVILGSCWALLGLS